MTPLRRGALVTVVLCLIVVLGAGLLKVSISGDPAKLLASSSSRYHAYTSILKHFPGEENQVLVFTEYTGSTRRSHQRSISTLAPTHLAAYRSSIAPLIELPDVIQVASLFSSPNLSQALTKIIDTPDEATASGLVDDVTTLLAQPDYLLSGMVSKDAGTLLMTLSLAPPAPLNRALPAIESVLKQHYADFPDISWTLAGNPVIERAISVDVVAELIRVTGLAILFGALVACWVLRRLSDVVQVIAVPIIAVVTTLSAMGWLGVGLNLLSQSVLIVVFLVVFTDTLHTLWGARSLRSLLIACALTSVTTATAGIALLFARSDVVQLFGVTLLIGISVGFMVWVAWLVLFFNQPNRRSNAFGKERKQVLWPVFTSASPRLRIAFALVSLLLLSIPALQLKTGFSLYENLPASHQASHALNIAETRFSGYLPLQVKIEALSEEVSVDDFVEKIRSLQEKLNSTANSENLTNRHWYSIADVLALTPGLNDTQRLAMLPAVIRDNFWNDDRSSMLFAPQLVRTLLDAPAGQLDAIDQRIGHLADEVGVKADVVTGLPALVLDASDDLFADAWRSVWITLVVLALVVIVSLRSVKFAFVAAVPVVFSMLGFAAILVFLGEPLRHSGVVLMTLIIGLSVDNALHLLMAIKHRDNISEPVAVQRCLPVLWASTLVIVIGFVALTVSHIPSLALVGFATASGLAIGFTVTAMLAFDLFASESPVTV